MNLEIEKKRADPRTQAGTCAGARIREATSQVKTRRGGRAREEGSTTMRCQYCGKDTKDGFPYCMKCGEWIGTEAPERRGTGFQKARMFLIRRPERQTAKA